MPLGSGERNDFSHENRSLLCLGEKKTMKNELPQGWFHVGDIKLYRELVEKIPEWGSLVELGVWKGRSLCSVSDIIIRKNIKVYAVDTFKGSKNEKEEHEEASRIDLKKEFENNLREFGINATIYSMTTNEAALELNDKYDLIFIDADHSEWAVEQDIKNWLPKCKGIIAGHDYERSEVKVPVDKEFPNVKYIHSTVDETRGTMWWNDTRITNVSNKKIDVIIPAYKAQNTIERTLASIVMQSIVDKLTITIVNDADGIGYEKFVNQFKEFVDIKEITMEVNGWPWVARQAGIDATTSPYFTCIDADDTFAWAFSLEILLRGVELNPEYHTIVGSFAEQHPHLNFINHSQDLVWMFGKLYTRSFCEKYKVRFNETRANEDNWFNTIIRLVSSDQEKIMFLPDIVYYWHDKPDSITRINNNQYSYDQSFVWYTDNMIYAIKHAKEFRKENPYIDQWAVWVMAQLYNYYYQTVKRDPRFVDQNYSYCVKYYNEIYKDIDMPKNDIEEIFANTLSEQAHNMKDNVPDKTIYQFIEDLKVHTK